MPIQALYEQHGKAIYNTLLRMLRNHADAEELLQETFLRLWERKDNCLENLKPLAFTIAMNLARSKLRYSKIRTFFGLEGVLTEDLDPHADLEQRQHLRIIEIAFSKLKAKHREILILARFSGLSYDELAQSLKIAAGTLASRLNQSRSNLKHEMEQAGWKEGSALDVLKKGVSHGL